MVARTLSLGRRWNDVWYHNGKEKTVNENRVLMGGSGALISFLKRIIWALKWLKFLFNRENDFFLCADLAGFRNA